jgi:hypothetical protein
MAYIGIGALIIAGVVIFLWLGKKLFAPKEIYCKGHTALGRMMCCRHCDAVVTQRTAREHGVHCAQRPPDGDAQRPSS